MNTASTCMGCELPKYSDPEVTITEGLVTVDGVSNTSDRDVNTISLNQCIQKLLDYYNSHGKFTDAQLAAFYLEFRKATGSSTFPKNVLAKLLAGTYRAMLIRAIFYTYLPMGLFFLATIWLMVASRWIHWIAGLILTVSLIVVLYAFGISYRISTQNAVDRKVQQMKDQLEEFLQKEEDSIKLLPVGLLKGICAAAGAKPVSPKPGPHVKVIKVTRINKV